MIKHFLVSFFLLHWMEFALHSEWWHQKRLSNTIWLWISYQLAWCWKCPISIIFVALHTYHIIHLRIYKWCTRTKKNIVAIQCNVVRSVVLHNANLWNSNVFARVNSVLEWHQILLILAKWIKHEFELFIQVFALSCETFHLLHFNVRRCHRVIV